MQRIVAVSLGLTLMAVPIVASASTLDDLLDQSRFLLSRIAAAQVNYDLSKPSCVITTSTKTVRVGEPFALVWGSSGSLDTETVKNTWPPNGGYVIVNDRPGTYTYTFKFYGAGSAQTSCQTKIIVK